MASGKCFLYLIFVMTSACFASMNIGLYGVETPPGPAMFVLGDSSVDCGDNNPLNGLFHRNLSRFPCNGSDTTLLPQLLGSLSPSLIKLNRIKNLIYFLSRNAIMYKLFIWINMYY